MTACKSIRDRIAFRFIRFGFRIALKNKIKDGYLKYLFRGDTYTFESKTHRDIMSLLKTDEERLKSPSEMQIEVSKKLENTIKAEAVKELLDKLIKEYGHHTLNEEISIDAIFCSIKHIVKEMVGEG